MKLAKLVMTSSLWLSCAVMAQQGPAVPVKTTLVQQQDVPVWIRGIGQVKAQQSVEIRPQVDGILQRILVEEGQLVADRWRGEASSSRSALSRVGRQARR